MNINELIKLTISIPQHLWWEHGYYSRYITEIYLRWSLELVQRKDHVSGYGIRVCEKTSGEEIYACLINVDDPNYHLLHSYYQTVIDCAKETRQKQLLWDFESDMQRALYGVCM